MRDARPGDLPIQMPRNYEFVVNARTARAIGYKIPVAIAQRADEEID